MTRGDMKADIVLDLSLTEGSDGAANPFTLASDIIWSANNVAGRTDCLFGVRTTGLVAEQTTPYCLPDLYRLNDVAVLDAAGKWRGMNLYDSPGDASFALGTSWRGDTSVDPPQDAILYGVNQVVLHPPASVTRAAALALLGWYRPGVYWVFDGSGNGVAATDADECPLPIWAHDAVVAGAKWRQAKRDNRPEVRSRAADLGAEYDRERGSVEQKAHEHHQNIAHSGGFWNGFVGVCRYF